MFKIKGMEGGKRNVKSKDTLSPSLDFELSHCKLRATQQITLKIERRRKQSQRLYKNTASISESGERLVIRYLDKCLHLVTSSENNMGPFQWVSWWGFSQPSVLWGRKLIEMDQFCWLEWQGKLVRVWSLVMYRTLLYLLFFCNWVCMCVRVWKQIHSKISTAGEPR